MSFTDKTGGSVGFVDKTGTTVVFMDKAQGSDADFLDQDGNEEFYATDSIEVEETFAYQTERGYVDALGQSEVFRKSVYAGDTDSVAILEALTVGLDFADTQTLSAQGELVAGIGDGGMGQLGIGGYTSVTG